MAEYCCTSTLECGWFPYWNPSNEAPLFLSGRFTWDSHTLVISRGAIIKRSATLLIGPQPELALRVAVEMARPVPRIKHAQLNAQLRVFIYVRI